MDQHLFGLLFGTGGLVFLVIGLVGMTRHLHRRRTWRRERGRAVDYQWQGGDNSVQHWVIERTDRWGRTHRTLTSHGSSGGTFRSFPFEVDLLVNPDDETQFDVASGARSGAGSLMAVLMGGLFAFLGFSLFAFGVLPFRLFPR